MVLLLVRYGSFLSEVWFCFRWRYGSDVLLRDGSVVVRIGQPF